MTSFQRLGAPDAHPVVQPRNGHLRLLVLSSARAGTGREQNEGMISMRKLLLAGAAMLSLAAIQSPAGAQGMAAPGSQPPGDAMTPPADPASPAPPSDAANLPADPSASPAAPPSDPNAGQPTGAVPPNPGMVPAPAGAPRDPNAPIGSDANPVTVGGNMTPPPTEMKAYPVCSRTVKDSCVNPGEARKRR